MNIALLVDKVRNLPQDKQAEVIDFVDFLSARCGVTPPADGASWSDADFEHFSMVQALRGLEHEPDLYEVSDLKERWL